MLTFYMAYWKLPCMSIWFVNGFNFLFCSHFHLYSFLQLFDFCLAPNTMGDGTGCDNMTCIIIVLNKSSHLKRECDNLDVSTSDEAQPEKRARLEEKEEEPSTNTWWDLLSYCVYAFSVYITCKWSCAKNCVLIIL